MSMRGLLIREPWVGKILAGEKSWEMRSKATSIRGEIALIRQGSGMVVGTAKVVDTLPALTRENYMDFRDRHAIPSEMLDEVMAHGWVHPWVLADVRQLPDPVPYKHGSGPVIFVSLDDSVAAAIRRQTGGADGGGSDKLHPDEEPAAGGESPVPDLAERTPFRDSGFTLHTDGTPVFAFRPQAAQAHGYPTADGFVVQKGSTAMRIGSPLVKRNSQLRDRLVGIGVLVPDADDSHLYRFATDYEFSSASAAAGVVKDGNASGPQLWMDVESGQSLRDFLVRHRTASRSRSSTMS